VTASTSHRSVRLDNMRADDCCDLTPGASRVRKTTSGGSDAPDFRGLLKAKAMGLSFPIQIVWEDVFDETANSPTNIRRSTALKVSLFGR
jgi:hypothetical protein